MERVREEGGLELPVRREGGSRTDPLSCKPGRGRGGRGCPGRREEGGLGTYETLPSNLPPPYEKYPGNEWG